MAVRKGIIGAGNWIVDQIKTIDRWPGEGNLCNILSQESAGGGGACNVLFDLAAMDSALPLWAAGRVGRDAAGDFLLSEIAQRHIDPAWMKRSEHAPTSFTDAMSGNGKRTFFHCRGANAEFDAADLAGIDVPAKIFYLGYPLLLDRLDAADAEFGTRGARLLSEMRGKGYRTAVDFVSEAPEKFRRVVLATLPQTDYLVINEVEAGNAFGVEIRHADGSFDERAVEPLMRRFFEHGLRQLLVIHYPEGACALNRDGKFCRTPSCKVEKIVGTTGAGDAFG